MTPEGTATLREILTGQHLLALGLVVEGEPVTGTLPYAVDATLTGLYVQASRLARHSARPGARSRMEQRDPRPGRRRQGRAPGAAGALVRLAVGAWRPFLRSPFPDPRGDSVLHFHSPLGRGLGLVTPILRACLRHPGVRFERNTKVVEPVSAGGRITGVRGVSTRSGTSSRPLRSFSRPGASSPIWRWCESSGTSAIRSARLLVGSGVNSVGSGHRMAQASCHPAREH
jgi:hypothetical protein